MKNFHCDVCDGPLFFENTHCTACHLDVGYFPDRDDMAGLQRSRYRPCRNRDAYHACNWMVRKDDPQMYCLSCRLTRTVPDLSREENRRLWQRIELAKRRLVYTLLELGLPVVGKSVEPEQGLAFEFLADGADTAGSSVLTGHANGLITLDIAEADDAERERRRAQLREPYRTLLGHLRHESGHYYWNLLIRDTEWLEDFRQLFGDETADYGAALQRHYEKKGDCAWTEHFVSSYAASHPWEDWAETWAHYLHMIDSLGTAAACGLALHPARRNEPAMAVTGPINRRNDFQELQRNWSALATVLNSLNRSMGMPDAYPFVVPQPALEKLRFVHTVIAGADPRLQDLTNEATLVVPATVPALASSRNLVFQH